MWGPRRVDFIYFYFFFSLSSTTTFLAVKAWLKWSNMLVQHHPTLLKPTCCTRLVTMLHQTSSSTSCHVSFVLRSEQQCGISLAITFNRVARGLALRLSVSMVIVYSLHLHLFTAHRWLRWLSTGLLRGRS